jgi:hypothetical protein
MVSLSTPLNAGDLEFVYLDTDEKHIALAAIEEARTARMKIQQEIAKTVKGDDLPTEEGSGGMFIMF